MTADAIATPDDQQKAHRVLVAEDDSLIRMDLIEMLREEGYDVVGEAPNGQVAVDLTESLTPDLVIMDIKMPVRDGIDAAAEAGITAVIQPGGSMRDQEVIDAANEHGIAMVFTGMRHFRH